METAKQKVDVSIVSGWGYSQFQDDLELTVTEPAAASTAGRKATNKDLMERRCRNVEPSSAPSICMPPPQQPMSRPVRQQILTKSDGPWCGTVNTCSFSQPSKSAGVTQLQSSQERNDATTAHKEVPFVSCSSVKLDASIPSSNKHFSSQLQPPRSIHHFRNDNLPNPTMRNYGIKAPALKMNCEATSNWPSIVVPEVQVAPPSPTTLNNSSLLNSLLRVQLEDSRETWLRAPDFHSGLQEIDVENDVADIDKLNYTATDVPWNVDFSLQPGDNTLIPSSPVKDKSSNIEAVMIAEYLAGEQFGELDMEELDRDEQELCKSLPPALSVASSAVNSADMTGLYGVDEITVRDSWLAATSDVSPVTNKGGARRMPVDDYLQTRSLALGSLSGEHDRQLSFGLHHHTGSSSAAPQLSSILEGDSFGGTSDTISASIEEASQKLTSKQSERLVPNVLASVCSPLVTVSEPDSVRTGGDGGSLQSAVASSWTREVNKLEAKNALCRSASVKISSTDTNRSVEAYNYHSLRRPTKNKVTPESFTGRSATSAPEVPELGGAREEATSSSIRSVIADISNSVPYSSIHARLLDALNTRKANALRCANEVNATQLDTVLDVSADVQLLRRQKELMKQKMFLQQQATNVAAMKQQEKTYGSVNPSSSAKCVSEPNSRPRTPPPSLTDLHRDKCSPFKKLSAKLLDGRLNEEALCTKSGDALECDLDILNDTVRLEPSPSFVISTVHDVMTPATREPPCQTELKEAPALSTLSVCEEPEQSGPLINRVPSIFVEGCVLGVATWLSVPISNPTDHYIRLRADAASETLDNKSVIASSLLFKHECVLEPRQDVVWALGICGKSHGLLKSVVRLNLEHATSRQALVTHVVPIIASITLPQVCVGNSNSLDLGKIPAGFKHDTSLHIYNKSERELAVIVSLSQEYSTPVFVFNNSCLKMLNAHLISEVEAACVLPSGKSLLPLTVMSPNLDGHGSNVQQKVLSLSCNVLVKMDSPELPRPILASTCISAEVVAIYLHIARSNLSIKFRTTPDAHTSAPLSLFNMSSIPLQLTFKWDSKDSVGKENLAVIPQSLVVESGSQICPLIVFTPLGNAMQFSTTLSIIVEPYGVEYKVSVEGESKQPDLEYSEKNVVKTFETYKAPSKLTKESAVPGLPTTSSLKPIEASKSRVVFGCADPNTTVTQKLSFFNRNDCDITISFNVSGICFSVIDPVKSTIVLPAQGIGAMLIGFSPKAVEAYSAVLTCKPRGLQGTKIKYTIQLQGLGGTCCLKAADNEVVFPPSGVGCPSIVRLAVCNTGCRAMCLANRAAADEALDANASSELNRTVGNAGSVSVLVQPEEVVLAPGDSQDVVVVCTIKANNLLRPDASGKIRFGYLQMTYCEEILRVRYRRRVAMGCKKVAASGVSSAVNWDVPLLGEKLFNESNSLPSQADDAKLFFASFRETRIALFGRSALSAPDASVTCFFPLAVDLTLADTTLSERKDIDVAVKRAKTVKLPDKAPVAANKPEKCSEVAFNKASALNVKQGAQLSAVNFDNKADKPDPKARADEPQVLKACEAQIKNNDTTGPARCVETKSQSNVLNGSGSHKVDQAAKCRVDNSNKENCPPCSNGAECRNSEKDIFQRLNCSGLEISPSLLSFPITAIHKQSYLKLSIKNPKGSSKEVLASVSEGNSNFVVKHPHFQVKAGHFVNIPVYFRPRSGGEHVGLLRLTVDSNSGAEVCLTGSAV